eukprot:811081-Amphidinium_carterae.1
MKRHRMALTHLRDAGLSYFHADESDVFAFLMKTSQGGHTPSRGVGVQGIAVCPACLRICRFRQGHKVKTGEVGGHSLFEAVRDT